MSWSCRVLGWENRRRECAGAGRAQSDLWLFVELGRAPSSEEVGHATGLVGDEVVAVWRDLHVAHALLLNPATTEIRNLLFPRCRPPIAWRPPTAGGTATAPGTQWASALPYLHVDGRIETSARVALRRSRSTFATDRSMTSGCCFIAWFPPGTGGTTSSSLKHDKPLPVEKAHQNGGSARANWEPRSARRS